MYASRTPDQTELHSIIRKNYRQVFYDKESHGVHLPFHLEREFKKYLKCGIHSEGMARFQCSCCGKDKFVAFSCKGRTICPSCSGWRTADTAKHLLDEVIPVAPVRQWVLSMPYTHRFLLATRPEYLRSALAIFHRSINRHYLKKAKLLKIFNPKVGAITVVQRFGGGLNLNVHFHSLYLDGVFYENGQGLEVFHEFIPTHEEIVKIVSQLKKRLTKLLNKIENINIDDFSINQVHAHSVQNRDEKNQLPIPIGKNCDSPYQEFKGMRCCYDDGFSLHANVKILAHERDGLERLCRYVLRGPLAKERISYINGKVQLKLKTPYSNGTTHLQFTPDQFIKRIIALIPPPRQNLIRYTGVFGARHTKRSVITSMAKPKKTKIKIKKKTYRTPWADLLKHVFKHEVSYCDHCGGKVKLIATISSVCLPKNFDPFGNGRL
ncbi:MAG: transposase [Bacteriovorax sp.]|nr:transposase [Bacteriovorax sp.]